MAIEDIFKSTCIASCGCCCSKETLCEKCEISTLRANGLPEECVSEIHGLSHRGNYSPLYWKLQELMKKHHQKMYKENV